MPDILVDGYPLRAHNQDAGRTAKFKIALFLSPLEGAPLRLPLMDPSHNHGPHHAIRVEVTNRDHPITKNLPGSWQTPKGELYNIAKVWPKTTPLATGVSKDPKKTNLCVWTSQYGKARVFGTTIGHHNETMQQEVYLDMVAAGLLWAVDKLDKDGQPAKGYGPKK